MAERGYLDASEMATTFNMLRENDLFWSFVINNYLMGRAPFPFDLLHWNADATRMPATMHSFYLRNMYMKNLLREQAGVELVEFDQPSEVKVPSDFRFKRVEVAGEALEADGIINLPKLKTHGQMTLSLGVKNLFDCVPLGSTVTAASLHLFTYGTDDPPNARKTRRQPAENSRL
jgi:hypothetical protein